MILIIDFGSQYTHMIGRRLKDLGVSTEIIDPADVLTAIAHHGTSGLILSGGPASVYEKGAPTIDPAIFKMDLPILGICYGWQLMAHLLGGEVESGSKEYGPSNLTVSEFSDLMYGLPQTFEVFESHGDSVMKLPEEFRVIASTPTVKFAAVRHQVEKWFGVQFHPEVHHSQHGSDILRNFATRECNLALEPSEVDLDFMIEEIRQKVGAGKVIGAISGGTDSSVAGTIVAKALGDRFIPVFIDSGLMREDAQILIEKKLAKLWGVKAVIVNARSEFLKRLKGVVDPEQKRKTIGKLYIDLFEIEMKKYPGVTHLLQGTTYADFIHSQGTKRSAHIKSHHNVGGLPKEMKLKLLEPLRYFYTDQVREIGIKLGLPKKVVYQQPYPGPGHAVRIMGEVTSERLSRQVVADQIVCEELEKSGWDKKVFQAWSIMTGAMSTAVKGDDRFYGEVIAVRAIMSSDRMTADWIQLPYEVLRSISARIVNEVPGISRVVYDITTKPPATIEWE